MTLEEIFYASQIIAAAALVGSLIYLALQTRQAARNQRAMMHANREQAVEDISLKIGDPTFGVIWRDAVYASLDMDILAAHQFAWFARAHLNRFQEHFLGWREGLIGDERWNTTRGHLQMMLSYPGYRAFYRMWRSGANPEFRALADDVMENMHGGKAPDDARTWLALAAEEREATSAQTMDNGAVEHAAALRLQARS
jgi:hypothetical protein